MKYFHISYLAKTPDQSRTLYGDALFSIAKVSSLYSIRENIKETIEAEYGEKFLRPTLLSVTPLSESEFEILGGYQGNETTQNR